MGRPLLPERRTGSPAGGPLPPAKPATGSPRAVDSSLRAANAGGEVQSWSQNSDHWRKLKLVVERQFNLFKASAIFTAY